LSTAEKKSCFVIGPIGDEGSPERINADFLLHYIIKPVVEDPKFGYSAIRADTISKPGMISSQVIDAVLTHDLIVADLSNRNPNAFYELALAHMAERPVIQMITEGEKIPFDLQDYRTVRYSRETVTGIEKAKDDLFKHLTEILTPGYKISNPVTVARGRQHLKETADSSGQLMGNLLEANRLFAQKLDALDERLEGVEFMTTVQSGAAGVEPPSRVLARLAGVNPYGVVPSAASAFRSIDPNPGKGLGGLLSMTLNEMDKDK
jgi:hypothetical protein